MQLSNTTYIYTDASYSKIYNVATIGNVCFHGTNEHETIPISEQKLNLLQIHESNNIRTEIRGALIALQSCANMSKVILYTDCQTICGLPGRRRKLESENFISQSSQTVLANADLYKEFYSTYDRLELEIIWIKGHSSGDKLNQIQKNFSYLDKEVRKKLRTLISETY